MPSVQTLIDASNSPAAVKAARNNAIAIYPEFPHDGCAYFLSELLKGAGMYVGIEPLAEGLATALKDHGWARVEVENYMVGDIGVAKHAPGTTNAAHIYLVLERQSADTANIIDNQAVSPHTRNVNAGPKTPAHYFLRSPLAQQPPINVRVNGAPVTDAEGFLTVDNRSRGWVRPVANALGALFVAITDSAVTLQRGTEQHTLQAEVSNGKAFVFLSDFTLFPGVHIGFTPPNTVDITTA